MARGSFVCNASIVGLWLGPGVGLWLEIHLFVMLVKLVLGWVQEGVCGRDSFVCNANIFGFWLGIGGGLWLEVHLFVMLV